MYYSRHGRAPRNMSNIQTIVQDFAKELTALIETQVMSRARSAVAAALGDPAPVVKRGPGRPPKSATASAALTAIAVAGPVKRRKKAPPQLCPVPGCKNKAAPIFGMVCAKHKDVAKSKIKKYREARKAKKSKG
jgi:hypothetical protein